MTFYDEDKFVLLDNDGVEQEFYRMITFSSNITNKKYLVYTDGKETNGKINIYSSILINDDKNNMQLAKLETEDDIEEVNKAIMQAKVNED